MCSANLVVKEVDDSPWVQLVVWSIDCMKRTLHEVVVVFRKMRYIHIRVLQPSVKNQPGIYNNERTTVSATLVMGLANKERIFDDTNQLPSNVCFM